MFNLIKNIERYLYKCKTMVILADLDFWEDVRYIDLED